MDATTSSKQPRNGGALFFAHAAYILAVLVFALGVCRLVVGFAIINGNLGADALARYAPGSATTGQLIDKSIYGIAFAIALGTLAEIAKCVRR